MLLTINENEIHIVLPDYNKELEVEDYKEHGPILDIDALLLVRLFKAVKAGIVLEIGTFMGKTANLLANNLEFVYTIDVIKDEFDINTVSPGQQSEVLPKDWVGTAIVDVDNAYQLWGDTSNVDTFNLLLKISCGGSFDGVFIDGNHRFSNIISDTIIAHAITRPGGVVVWHDVKEDGVVEVIPALKALSSVFNIYIVLDSWIAFMVVKK